MIPLNDLQRQYKSIAQEIQTALVRVAASGWYVLGPEVEAFEQEFASYCQSRHCVGVANGTEALEIGLRTLGIGPGDEVITVANAGMYSTTAIRAVGATPVFADVHLATLTLDPHSLPGLVSPFTRAVIVTHLYGRIANMPAILSFTRQHGLALVEDCAQAHGAKSEGKIAGSWGDLSCFSFYPTKNLGALGDGGAIVTSNAQFAARARMLRQYGWDRKYHNQFPGGRNSRLDEIQAAVLRTKLPYLDGWNQERRRVASQYQLGLAKTGLGLPEPVQDGEMIYHLYVVRTTQRERLMEKLRQNGVGCDIHYPIPDHLQPACASLGGKPGMLPVTEQAAQQVLSLPCFAELSIKEIEQVARVIQQALL